MSNKETRYVVCDSCGDKIYLGSEVYCFDGYCGVFCSAECYANAHATTKILDEEEADNCRCIIYDEDERKREAEELQKEIEKLQSRLDKIFNK